MNTQLCVLVALLVACPTFALIGVKLAQWNMRRALDQESEEALLRGLPAMLAIERGIRKPVIDRQCEIIKRRYGEAAYSDIHMLGREITLVGAQPDHLEGFAKACSEHREALEAVMKQEHSNRKGKSRVTTDSKVVEFPKEDGK